MHMEIAGKVYNLLSLILVLGINLHWLILVLQCVKFNMDQNANYKLWSCSVNVCHTFLFLKQCARKIDSR